MLHQAKSRVCKTVQDCKMMWIGQVLIVVALFAINLEGVICAIQRDAGLQIMASNEVQQNLAESGYPLGSGDAMVNLVASSYPAPNSKRARKMSAFMPMRGRKDGRDQAPRGQFEPDMGIFLDTPLGLLGEPEGDSSILRLVASDQGRMGFGGPTPTPRQFASQFALRHLGHLGGGGGGGDEGAETGGYEAGLMQAKLRRAFHPMRGKKSMEAELIDPQADF